SALEDWQERSWRGVQLVVNPTAGWRVRLRFPTGTEWFDEPWMADGTHALRLEVIDDAIELGGFPPGRTYRIGLPLYLNESSTLTLEGLAGRATVVAGTERTALAAGETRRLDLLAADLLARPLAPPGPGHVVIRARPRPRQGEVSIDPETRKLLQSLGYLSN
ncbi:MAG: hypothetical protein GTN89_12205, partial [Acidobacteria bacterium]|nr:hypothetical protein [Acidobacteriota bacterium]NIM63243.1 hypothetical protein [Acidobacteriota bacterium]NIO60036.1 hypothetical protein [Acidobacteriota bacterium]NIQ31107.1 hypothetical protein [Acidobacteriota bacterium]NIQ86216.1 hypothetical protein [Acidobacteriota bacterium]